MLASPAGQKEDGSSIPLYMLCLDLAFAASWSVAAQWITYGDEAAVPRYFLIFVPIAWVWDQTNRVFNRFDTKDIVSLVSEHRLIADRGRAAVRHGDRV